MPSGLDKLTLPTHSIEESPAEAQKPNMQYQSKFMSRSTARGNHHVFVAAEREEGLQFRGAKFTWKVFETKVSGLPVLHRLCPSIRTPTLRQYSNPNRDLRHRE